MMRLIREVNKKMQKIGFELNVQKWRSLSLTKGLASDNNFKIGDIETLGVSHDPMKFLGIWIFRKN